MALLWCEKRLIFACAFNLVEMTRDIRRSGYYRPEILVFSLPGLVWLWLLTPQKWHQTIVL
jgi:hypothetical protein